MRGKVRLRQGFHLCDGITPACAGKSEKTRSITTTRRDHPRVCGEKKAELTPDELSRGSPPRMRGKAVCNADRLRAGGITPAYAGKSDGLGWHSCCPGDHPRVCGEKYAPNDGKRTNLGSPPRMRGKVPCSVFHCFGAGITPAYAGKSQVCSPACRLGQDHPRVCGEKNIWAVAGT